ncbi:homoserine dehydrogenase [Pseudoramibacter sp.]|uniref:homoserine dehydrogenase n=1 Tax=Pseudoramibacter sp. TaxID=2034862 RepID=UPI0025FB8773|nr:homoserine dehydrogenase [Pseudoramibacter sp.]MCH4072580.1 homoserine dehydrogenase [Pseudoramibacter sp.]MCH4106351.1 homoserine dehydrogenase [Pseudoramibacter sp.]
MNIALLGFGTIGSGVYELINLHKGRFADNLDEPVYITKILDRDPNKKVDPSDHHCEIVTDPDLIMNDPEIKIVVSLLGGMDFEYKMIKTALEHDKNVVTASKAVLSEYFAELNAIADEHHVFLRYEAAVGGGIPIIGSLNEELKINHIDEIKGILNGTTNFILSKMTENNADFDETLKLAQKIGFAEADPTADIEGYDVSRKLAILSTLAYGGIIRDEDIKKRGLSDVEAVDVEMVKSIGYVIKYLGHSKLLNKNQVYTTVEPVLFPNESMMGHVDSEFNIISIKGDVIGELQFYGKGAGKDATANAVVGDVLYIINSLKEERRPHYKKLTNELHKMGNSGFSGRYYLRVHVTNNDELAYVMSVMDADKGRGQIVVSGDDVFFTTSEIQADVFDSLVDRLKERTPKLFYARIYE